jgi:RNA polymerase sigma-70 factor, ECF subfamily
VSDPQTRPAEVYERWLAADVSAAALRHAQAGAANELDGMLAALRPILFTYFSRRVDATAADDLTQRALLVVTREYRRITPDGAAQWLVTIARNVVRDEFRRTSRAAGRRAPAREARALAAPDATQAWAEYRELADAVIDATHTACSASQRAVVLGVLRGLEYSEIADQLGVTELVVRVRLCRARALLRRKLKRFHEDAPATHRPLW